LCLVVPSQLLGVDETNTVEIETILSDQSLYEALQELDEQLTEQGGVPFLRSWFQQLKAGEMPFNWETVKTLLSSVAFYQLRRQSGWLGQILVIGVICIVLEQMRHSFDSSGPSNIASLVCLVLITVAVVQCLQQSLKTAQVAITGMNRFMEILLPLIMVLMLAMGHGTTVAVMKPLVLGALSALTVNVRYIIFPLIMIYLALTLVNGLTDKHPVGQLAKFIKQLIQWGIGLTMTLFTAALSLSGGFAAVADGVTLRTAKFMAGSVVPVAGKLFADLLDSAAGASLLLKSSLGAIGFIVIMVILGLPLLQIFLQAMVLRLASAVLEPLGDAKTSTLLNELSSVLLLLFTVLAAVGMMVLLAIGAVLLAGNAAVMLR